MMCLGIQYLGSSHIIWHVQVIQPSIRLHTVDTIRNIRAPNRNISYPGLVSRELGNRSADIIIIERNWADSHIIRKRSRGCKPSSCYCLKVRNLQKFKVASICRESELFLRKILKLKDFGLRASEQKLADLVGGYAIILVVAKDPATIGGTLRKLGCNSFDHFSL